MGTEPKIDWFAPTLMLGAWLGGIVVALGHHFYYNSLAGSPADSHESILGFGFSSQQLSNALGTAFAFVARALLILATSVAYVQLFWRVAMHQTKPNALVNLDTMFSGLSNLFAFGRVSAWYKNPVLLLVALISWLLPLAFIIPAGTLSVVLVSNSRFAIQDVPNLDLTSFNYVAGLWTRTSQTENGIEYGDYVYNGPSFDAKKVAVAVAAQNAILPIDAPAENSSWALDFYGPSLSCGVMNNTIRSKVEPNIANWLYGQPANCEGRSVSYLSWNPSLVFSATADGDGLNAVPFVNQKFLKGDKRGPFTPIYVALLPETAMDSCWGLDNNQTSHLENPSFFQCDLHNASYHVNFRYESGVQNIAVNIDRLGTVENPDGAYSPLRQQKTPNGTCFGLVEYLSSSKQSPCEFDTDLLRRLSYTGIMDAFNQLITGSVSISDLGIRSIDTDMFVTSLIDTAELRYLWEFVNSPQNATVLQTQFTSYITSQDGASANMKETTPRLSLPRVMEDMFTNFTISLMGSKSLQPNPASPFRPPPANVTIITQIPVYSYSPTNLWIAYGSAILAASLALVAGIVALVSSGASYNSDFSSIMRAAYGAELSTSVEQKDAHAAAPLPSYLKTATVSWLTPGDGKLEAQQQSSAEDSDSQVVDPHERNPDHPSTSNIDGNVEQMERDVEHRDPTVVPRRYKTRDGYEYQLTPGGSRADQRYTNLPWI